MNCHSCLASIRDIHRKTGYPECCNVIAFGACHRQDRDLQMVNPVRRGPTIVGVSRGHPMSPPRRPSDIDKGIRITEEPRVPTTSVMIPL